MQVHIQKQEKAGQLLEALSLVSQQYITLGMVVHAYNPRLWNWEKEESSLRSIRYSEVNAILRSLTTLSH